ncbi:hypothetical protein B296_00045456 [Ensete ventricosum]|uniref:Uncharacterized protein n=1 Tax=Ensete ventricosum TaxID=4639 RepID=A0A426Z7C4_ENSVE|nr:hypothetical protein B296_00045456 [Ensete ventricosum]
MPQKPGGLNGRNDRRGRWQRANLGGRKRRSGAFVSVAMLKDHKRLKAAAVVTTEDHSGGHRGSSSEHNKPYLSELRIQKMQDILDEGFERYRTMMLDNYIDNRRSGRSFGPQRYRRRYRVATLSNFIDNGGSGKSSDPRQHLRKYRVT